MQWLALRWQLEEDKAAASTAACVPAAVESLQDMPLSTEALGWWALRFTPRVAWLDEALMLEVSACERLWGGQQQLMRQMTASNPVPDTRLQKAQGATSLVALARLRLFAVGAKPPEDVPAALPLHTLTAARDKLDVLARMGCRTWGDVAALPRGGLTRRFGKSLREALDAAWGLHPERHVWLTLPDAFEQKLELPALAESAPELMWSAQRLLASLQVWLRVRQRGVLALELQWTLDLKRHDGVDLPPYQGITVRTAEATQDIAHLRRLMSERLALTQLAAPASWLRLRSIDTVPWAGASTSFLPEDNRKGDKLHELVERLSARLGAQQVVVSVAHADHRPERMQTWLPALRRPLSPVLHARAPHAGSVFPAWMLHAPLLLEILDGHPCYQGRLRRLSGPQKLEAGWWAGSNADGLALRDYYIAESPRAGLVWVFRERSPGGGLSHDGRWFLQGLYA